MKNTLKLLSLIVLCSAFVCSCAKEQLQPENEDTESQTGNALVATIALPDDSASKLAYEENGVQDGLSSKWEEGDYIYALKDGKDLVRFNIIKGVGTSTGHFIAYVDYNKDTQWKVILGKKITASNGVATCSYLGQDGTVARLGDYDYIVAAPAISTDEYGNITSFEVDFNNGTRLSYFFRIKLPAGIRYVEYCTTTFWNISATENSIGYDGNFDNVSMIDLGHESSAGECCYLSVPATQYMYHAQHTTTDPDFENPVGIIITFFNSAMNKSNGKVFNNNLTGKGGKIATLDVSSMTLIDRALADEAIDFGPVGVVMRKDEGGVNSYNNLNEAYHSTVVNPAWAPFNLDAKVTSASGQTDLYGGYYCWGETAPRTTIYNAGSGTFAEGIYTYKGDKTVGDQANFPSTHLGIRVEYQTTSGRMILQQIAGTKYDAARVRWGSEWRMPTIEELYEFTGGSTTCSTSNKANTPSGFKATSYRNNTDYPGLYTYYGKGTCGRLYEKNGKSIFFPFCGYYHPGHAYEYSRGFYWGDSRIRATPSNGDLSNNPPCAQIQPGSVQYENENMYYGLNIRPVLNRPITNQSSASAPVLAEDGGATAYNVSGTVKDNTGAGIGGVVISDGYKCWKTKNDGTYYIMADSRARTISVTVPAEYQIPMSNGLPAFYRRVTIPTDGSKLENQDFVLTARSSVPERFTIIAIADAHVSDASDRTKFQTSISDITNTAKALGTAIPVGPSGQSAGEVIAIALGDQLTNNMGMSDNVIADFKTIKDKDGNSVPVFFTIGNHDHDSAQADDYSCEAFFVSKFGPTNYSFDIGNAHIVVMDDLIATGTGVAGQTPSTREGFTDEQVAWLRDDISKVTGASNKIGILCVHAPLSSAAGGDQGTQSGVMSAFKNNFKNVHVLSGHTHCIKNNLYRGWAAKSGRNIYEHTLQSLAGYWWKADISYNAASPAGYGVMTFDQNDIYAEYNKVTKEAAGFQMRNYNGGATYNPVDYWDKIRHGGARGYKEYTWPSPVTKKLVTRIPDAGPSNDSEDYWEVKVGSTAMTRVPSDNPVLDVCAASYVFNELKGPNGDANVATDQIWYSSSNYSSSFTVTAIHHMKSGWSATYTSTKIVGTDYKGFAYGERY